MLVASEDKLLWERVSSGDHRAFAELFDKYWEPFFQYSYRILQDREQTEEVVQEFFIALWSRRSDLPAMQSVKAYIFTMLKNRILNHMAKKKVRQVSLDTLREDIRGSFSHGTDEPGGAAEILERKSSDCMIRDLAAGLPEKMQRVYIMHQFSGLSISEIASVTGSSEQTIRNQFNTALKRLSIVYRGTLFILLFYDFFGF